MMQVTIHGPNLRDQSKGQFHIHALECRDNHREIMVNGSEFPWTVEAESKRQVVEEVYADQMSEGASYEACRDDLYFEPCLKELPEEKEE